MKVTLQVLFGFILTLTPVKGTPDDESQFDKDADCNRIKVFYKEQHGEYHSWMARVVADFVNIEKQTLRFNIKARVAFKTRRRARMSVWEAIELLNTLVDDSDHDVSSPSSGILTHLTKYFLDKY
jgi:hypothetical protein